MKQVLVALRQRTECKGIVVFRTYTPESRCPHADADTPLAADLFSDVVYGFCEQCISEEIERRQQLPPLD
jgi:hypothetical protein